MRMAEGPGELVGGSACVRRPRRAGGIASTPAKADSARTSRAPTRPLRHAAPLTPRDGPHVLRHRRRQAQVPHPAEEHRAAADGRGGGGRGTHGRVWVRGTGSTRPGGCHEQTHAACSRGENALSDGGQMHGARRRPASTQPPATLSTPRTHRSTLRLPGAAFHVM